MLALEVDLSLAPPGTYDSTEGREEIIPDRAQPSEVFVDRATPSERAGVLVQALHSLGMIPDTGQEIHDRVTEGITRYRDVLLIDWCEGDGRVETGYRLPIDSVDFTFEALITAWFGGREGVYRDRVWAPLWQRFSAADLNKANPDEPGAEPTKPGLGTIMGMMYGSGHASDDALFGTGRCWRDQTAYAGGQISGYNETHTASGLSVMTPSEMIIMQAQRREEGWPLIDTRGDTETRYVQHDNKPDKIDGLRSFPGGPCSHTLTEPAFEGSDDRVHYSFGVRFSLAQRNQETEGVAPAT